MCDAWPEDTFWHVCFQAIRQHDEGGSVSTALLATLARTASACARLHLRDTVLAMPDAVLAIMLLEASDAAKARTSPSKHASIRQILVSSVISRACMVPHITKARAVCFC